MLFRSGLKQQWPSQSSGGGGEGGGSPFGLSDLPWRVVPLGTEEGDVGLGELEGHPSGPEETPLPISLALGLIQGVWLLLCFLGSWWAHMLNLRMGWKGLITREAKSQR